MVLEVALFVGGLAGTLALGIPVVLALTKSHRWHSQALVDGMSRERGTYTAVFTPLDLGPDPVKWPSERPWRGDQIADPQWPSKSWDDEHFGSHWREGRTVELGDLGFHAMAGRRYDHSIDEEEVVRRNEEASRRRYLEAQRRQQQQQQQQRALGQRERQQQAQAPTPRRPPPRQAAQPQQPEPQLQLPQVQPPAREELEALIAKVGLAGTVQAIMNRTGWDFRQAAHYLAKIRQGG